MRLLAAHFHPEDDIIITEKCKMEDAFQDSLALVRQEFLSLLANLKRDIPFYSPRYIGHMLGDQLLPAIAAYFAAMLHNPNNVTLEASPIATRYEMEVAQQLAGLMNGLQAVFGFRCGYAKQPAKPAPRRGVNEVIEGV